MKEWHDILAKALTKGTDSVTSKGYPIRSLFGEQLEFSNTQRFPAVTTKQLGFSQVAAELLCFLRGYDTLEQFHMVGCHIWDANAQKNGGKLGPIYGAQWRGNTGGPDQLAELLLNLKERPDSKRHVVSCWNPKDLPLMCLPPCATEFQVRLQDGRLDMRVGMRSVDLFLGLPFDVASFALLQRLIAEVAGITSGRLVFQLGDAHVYHNHFGQVELVLGRRPLQAPFLKILEVSPDLRHFEAALEEYASFPMLPAPLNV